MSSSLQKQDPEQPQRTTWMSEARFQRLPRVPKWKQRVYDVSFIALLVAWVMFVGAFLLPWPGVPLLASLAGEIGDFLFLFTIVAFWPVNLTYRVFCSTLMFICCCVAVPAFIRGLPELTIAVLVWVCSFPMAALAVIAPVIYDRITTPD